MTKSSISSSSASKTRSRPPRLGRWSGAAGVAISIALLWWTLHDVSLADVWEHLRGAKAGALLLTVVIATATFPLRMVRWRYLLRYEGEALPLTPLWHAVAIGFMANNLLPARAGEVARAYAVRRLAGVRFSTAFASIAVERVLDGLTLVVILMLAMWAGGFAPGTAVGNVTLGGVARGAGLIFGTMLLIAFACVHWPGPALRLAERSLRLLFPERWAVRALQILAGMLAGLEALRSPRQVATVVFWSFAVWGTAALSFWTGYRAFGIDVPWPAAFLAQGLVAFGVAIPSSPGFFGPFEAVVRIALALYGVEASRAVSFAVGYHIFTFVPITVLGIWSLSRGRMHLQELRSGSEGNDGSDGNDATRER